MAGPDIERFAALQARLRALEGPGDERTIVVIPSLNVDPSIYDAHALAMPAYEERWLYLLFALRRPGVRVVMVTSLPVPEEIVAHYLACMPDVPDARERLHMIDAGDASSRPLAVKLLGRPDLLEAIAALVDTPENGFIMPFNVEQAECLVALRLNLPLYGIDHRFHRHGTKSGSRRLFARAGVPHAAGVDGLRGIDDVRGAVAQLRRRVDGLGAVVAKHDDGVAGEGNAVLTLNDLPPAGSAGESAALDLRLRSLAGDWLDELRVRGGIVEELVTGAEVRSPSVQVRVLPEGRVRVISTHDQVLGGPLGQTYIGCRFPADPEYSVDIVREARKVGDALAREGAVGRFGVDFIAARDGDGRWRVDALEINLREGGTSHPFGTLWLLTDGSLGDGAQAFDLPDGTSRCYFATDTLEDRAWRGLRVADLLDAAGAEGLLYDATARTGVVLHMLRALELEGRLSVVAIGATPEDADRRYLALASLLDRMAA